MRKGRAPRCVRGGCAARSKLIECALMFTALILVALFILVLDVVGVEVIRAREAGTM
jgi:hypothetical protein